MKGRIMAVAVLILALMLPANAAISATSVEVRGEVFNSAPFHRPDGSGCFSASANTSACQASWNAYNFAGFWYDLKNGLMSESMNITTFKTGSSNRTIDQKNLWYNTTKQIVQFKVSESISNATVEQGYDANGVKQSTGAGYYYKIGWQAEPYVALNGKAKKLVKLLIEQGKSTAEKQTLTVGQTWDVGGGWTLQAQSIDAKASPRQAWLILSKDGVKKDDKIAYQGNVYTYVEKSIGGESDTPLFVTYIDSVFAGATTDMVQLRYTWAVDTSVTEVKSADKFGIMKVTDAGDTTLTLWNEDSSVSLSKDSTVDIMGNMKFKVADNDIARFYPYVEYVIGPGGNVTPTPTTGGGTPQPTVNATQTPKTNFTPPVTTPQMTTPQATTPSQTTPKPTQKEPGFEAAVAIAGLLGVAYLVLRQRK
ncbi:MAG TPA: S-layer protein domain-containing protein [Candidatus Methanoperedens sp.]